MFINKPHTNISLQIKFNQHFNPNFKTIQQHIKTKNINQPKLLHITNHNPNPPPLNYIKISNKLFLNITIHNFNITQFLINSKIYKLQIYTNTLINPTIKKTNNINTTIISLHFKNKTLNLIKNNQHTIYNYNQQIKILNSKNILSNLNPHHHQISFNNPQNSTRTPLINFFINHYQQTYQLKLKSFIHYIKKKTTPQINNKNKHKTILLKHTTTQTYQKNTTIKIQ